MKPRVLWIEDSARLELASLAGPVFHEGSCDLGLAEDVSTAVKLVLRERYDVLIVDIRLPPGRDAAWRGHYEKAGASKVTAQLGLQLLYWLLKGRTSIYKAQPPDWVSPDLIAVFTVETRRELHANLEELGVSVFEEKTANIADDTLARLINEVLERNGRRAE